MVGKTALVDGDSYCYDVRETRTALGTTRETREDHERREIVKKDSVSDDFICGLFFFSVYLLCISVVNLLEWVDGAIFV